MKGGSVGKVNDGTLWKMPKTIKKLHCLERLKKYCSPAERGFLGLGEALAKAQVSENPETSG